LLLAVVVSVVCVVGITPVLAQGPDRNPIYATVEYVDQMVADLSGYVDQKVAELYTYVDERIGEVGGGGSDELPDWRMADGYEWTDIQYAPWEPRIYYLMKIGQGCSFGEDALAELRGEHVLAIAHFPDGEVIMYSSCLSIYPEVDVCEEDLPAGEIQVDVWIEWMGETKKQIYTVNPPQPPAP